MELTLTRDPELEALLVAQRPGLEALARRLVWDDEEARDLVQAAMLSAVVGWHTLRDPQAAPGWLRRVLVSKAMSHLRRRKLLHAVAGLLFVEPEPPRGPEDSLVEKRRRADLGAALAALPARQGAAFSLRYLEGLSLDEVADAMGVGRGTARIHLQRAVRKLRDRGLLHGEEP